MFPLLVSNLIMLMSKIMICRIPSSLKFVEMYCMAYNVVLENVPQVCEKKVYFTVSGYRVLDYIF